MVPIKESSRISSIEKKWGQPLEVLLHKWHWDENLKHSEIGTKIGIPRPTVTRWFRQFHVPTQSCARFTNFNLLNTGLVKGPRAKPKIKRIFPWKFDKGMFNAWSQGMAYLLGFLAADGYVFTNKRGSSYVCFCSTDGEIIEKIRRTLNSNHKIGIRIRSPKYPNHKDFYVLQIGSKVVVKRLEKFGIIQNKSLVIYFPKVPSEFLGDFIRGYFDGDGGVSFIKNWRSDRKKWTWLLTTTFTSGSKKFIVGLQGALRKFLAGGYLYKKDGNTYDLHFSKNDSLALFRLMYNNTTADLFLERKYRTFLRAFQILNMRA